MLPGPDGSGPARVVSTDVGIDDALAMLLIERFARPPLEAVIASGGNVRAEHVACNCAHMRERFGLQAPLFRGTDPPPTGGDQDAAHVHGPTGLGPFRSSPVDVPPIPAFVRDAQRHESVDLLVLGPATDAALLLRHPITGPRVRSVTLMGGAFGPRDGPLGNVTPWAEFNAYMDPAALWDVAGACESRIVPLDATEQRLFAVDELSEGLADGPNAGFVRELLEFSAQAHEKLGCGWGVFMHDAIAAAVWLGLIDADWRETGLAEVVRDGRRRGLTRARDDAPVRIRYARRVDMDAFLALWREVVAGL
jgi:inosine-uridine nucleoside N-ribohydrolase